MTFPTSLTKTFDTSLVDVNRSFSSTDTNTSVSSSNKGDQLAQPVSQPAQPLDPEGNEAGASALQGRDIFTNDGAGEEVLNAIDVNQMREWVPLLVSALQQQQPPLDDPYRALTILDLGCGTGRNTLKLLNQPWTRPAVIVGCDTNAAKLDVLRAKCESQTRASNVQVRFDVVGFINPASIPEFYTQSFDAVVASLMPNDKMLLPFFSAVAKVLRSGGCAIVTGMHPEISGRIQAAEVSHIQMVGEVVGAATEAGLGLLGEVEEVAVTREMVEDGVVSEKGKGWIGVKMWYGLKLRKVLMV